MSINSSTRNNIVAIVPAAGVGSRMHSAVAKQYLTINDECIITLTLKKLLQCESIVKIVVALNKNDQYFSSLEISQHPKITTVVGGETRALSVLRGLQAIQSQQFNWALVHDAARPCVSVTDINALITQCISTNKGAILATPVCDTMKRTNGQLIVNTEARDNLWHALTPQMFATQTLLNSLSEGITNNLDITDEASAVEFSGGECFVVPSSSHNIKITQPQDLPLAKLILAAQQEEQCE